MSLVELEKRCRIKSLFRHTAQACWILTSCASVSRQQRSLSVGGGLNPVVSMDYAVPFLERFQGSSGEKRLA